MEKIEGMTAEQYAVQKAVEFELKFNEEEFKLKMAKDVANVFEKRLEKIKSIAEVKVYDNKETGRRERYVSFSSAWEKSDPDLYNELVCILELNEPEIEEAADGSKG